MTLQEKLLQDRNLDLEKCIDMCRAAESTASQVKNISTTKMEVNKIGFRNSSPKSDDRPPRHHTENGAETKAAKRRCKFCGRRHQFSPEMRPARGKTCNKCGKPGRFAAKYGSRAVHQVEADSDADDSHARGEVGSVTLHQINAVDSMGRAKMRAHGKFVNFLLDTGANANLISTHDAVPDKLQNSDAPGPGAYYVERRHTENTGTGKFRLQSKVSPDVRTHF